MSKDPHFIGQPVLNQLFSFLPGNEQLKSIAKRHHSDHYTKHFDSSQHLKTMLFSLFMRLDSLREVQTGLGGHENKLRHIGINSSVARSTLSDANKRRTPEFFASVYSHLLSKYRSILSDSRLKESEKIKEERLYALDSTTISLFTSIYTCSGRKRKDGKSKGGVKVHTLMQVDEHVPVFLRITDAVDADTKHADLAYRVPKDALLLIDRGYVDYGLYERLSLRGISYVTRVKRNMAYYPKGKIGQRMDQSVLLDQEGVLKIPEKQKNANLGTYHKARRIAWYNKEKKRYEVYLTNNFELSADQIHDIYLKRWQIETLFKQLKQNFELKYFMGDNKNAIQIQIWCAIIANLLLTILRRTLTSRWAFSIMAKNVSILAMTYVDIIAYLNEPKKAKKLIQEKLKDRENRPKQITLYNLWET